MPKAYKNNGVCNIIPGIPNGSSLKGEISSIRQLHSSMHSRERRGKRVRCEHLPASGDPQPSLEYYKALPHYYSPLHYKPPSCCMDVSVFLCIRVCVCVKILFFFSPGEPMLTRPSYLHALGSSVHPQTKGLQCLSPKIEQRNSVYSVREAPL